MGRIPVLALRAVLALSVAGALGLQTVLVTVLAVSGLDGDLSRGAAVAVVVLSILALLALQVVAVCVWRLLTMATDGRVFTPAASRWVDVVIGALFVAAGLVLVLGVVLAPGEAVPPGAVLVVGGSAVVLAGIGLIVVVMRALLHQAVARDAQATELQAELDTVI
jgi:hypothetical protein